MNITKHPVFDIPCGFAWTPTWQNVFLGDLNTEGAAFFTETDDDVTAIGKTVGGRVAMQFTADDSLAATDGRDAFNPGVKVGMTGPTIVLASTMGFRMSHDTCEFSCGWFKVGTNNENWTDADYRVQLRKDKADTTLKARVQAPTTELTEFDIPYELAVNTWYDVALFAHTLPGNVDTGKLTVVIGSWFNTPFSGQQFVYEVPVDFPGHATEVMGPGYGYRIGAIEAGHLGEISHIGHAVGVK